MKTAALSDLAFAAPRLRTDAIRWTIVLLATEFLLVNSPSTVLLVAVPETLAFIQTLAIDEERCGWNRLRLALPITRAEAVAARFAVAALVAAGAVALTAGTNLLVASLFAAVPTLGEIAILPTAATGIDTTMLALCCCASMSLALVAAGTFVRVDGLRSIRRSHRADELRRLAGTPWRVQRLFPSRLLLSLEVGRG